MQAPANSAPAVTIGIVSWNTRELLENCLTSLTRDARDDLVEIVVVDNGSTDGTVEMLDRFSAVRNILNTDNRGFARATNQAFDAGKAPYFLMLNSDASVTEGSIAKCAAYLDNNPSVAVVGCRVAYPDGRFQSSCFRFKNLKGLALVSLGLSQAFPRSWLLNWDRYGWRQWNKVRQVDCVMGGFMMVRRSAIRERPLLDEGYFMYGEEEDLCYRLHRDGWKTVYYPFVEVRHHHSASSKRPQIAAWAYAAKRRAVLRFLDKWRGTTVAWLANAIYALDLAPRTVGWTLLDLVCSARDRRWGFDRLLKARAMKFHLAALFRPSLFKSEWSAPPSPPVAT